MELSKIMEFDHVVHVTGEGDVIDAPKDIYAPEAYEFDGATTNGTWSLMNGYSGQYSYAGPWMHSSEYIGGKLAADILAKPGYYVAITGHDDNDEQADSWAVARREV